MSGIIIKEGEKKIDHPSRDSVYRKTVEKVNRTGSRVKFENAAQERDYERRVNANPYNVKGMPAFYPEQKIRNSSGFGSGSATELLPCNHRWVRMAIRDQQEIFICRHGHEFQLVNQEYKTIN